MRRIIFRTSETDYRAFGFEFKRSADGSFYLSTQTAPKPDGSQSEPFKLSYHATGRINYSGPISEKIFGEPIYAITKPQDLFRISLANIDRLPKIVAAREDDIIVPVSSLLATGRLTLHALISPPGREALGPDAIQIQYPEWFALQIVAGPPPLDIAPDKSTLSVLPGPYSEQQVSESQALISVHQKASQTADLIMWWEDPRKCFRLIFAVPMCRPPLLEVEFSEPNLEVVPMVPTKHNTETAELRFQVRGPGGLCRNPPRIIRVMLHAEL